MSAPSWRDNFSALMDAALEAFGDPVTFRPQAGDAYDARGIFDAHHVIVDMNAEAQVSSTAPVLDIKLADFSATPKQGDRFDINGATYEVADTQLDGHGGAKLMLLKVT